jgi:hypothetical protein
MSEGDILSVITHWLEACPVCGAWVSDPPSDCAHCENGGELKRIEVVPAEQLRGAVAERDELRAMLVRLLDVALVDGYGETVRDEAERLLARLGGQ